MSEADKIIKNLKNSGKKVEEFYVSNKTSDKNVVTEEDIRVINKIISFYKNIDILYNKEIQALERVLAEREQDKKRIQELEEELEKANKQLDLDYVDENYIPKQVIIDKVNEINKKYEDSKDENGESPYFYPDFTIRILQELLEGERK